VDSPNSGRVCPCYDLLKPCIEPALLSGQRCNHDDLLSGTSSLFPFSELPPPSPGVPGHPLSQPPPPRASPGPRAALRPFHLLPSPLLQPVTVGLRQPKCASVEQPPPVRTPSPPPKIGIPSSPVCSRKPPRPTLPRDLTGIGRAPSPVVGSPAPRSCGLPARVGWTRLEQWSR
jgi:hypothetical protein